MGQIIYVNFRGPKPGRIIETEDEEDQLNDLEDEDIVNIIIDEMLRDQEGV